MPAFGAAGSDSARARLLLTRARRQRLGRRRTLVLDKEDEYLRGFGFARVARNRVDIARQLVEGVALDERHFLPSLDLHHDRALEHVDEYAGVVTMRRRCTSGRVFDRNHRGFLPRYADKR